MAESIPESAPEQCKNPHKPECINTATPGDHRGMCLDCNPYGDSAAMNNDPEYFAWLFRPETY